MHRDSVPNKPLIVRLVELWLPRLYIRQKGKILTWFREWRLAHPRSDCWKDDLCFLFESYTLGHGLHDLNANFSILFNLVFQAKHRPLAKSIPVEELQHFWLLVSIDRLPQLSQSLLAKSSILFCKHVEETIVPLLKGDVSLCFNDFVVHAPFIDF